MATILSGLVDTEDVLSNERVVDMSERIGKLQPDTTQFTTMLQKIGSKKATREVIDWLEDEYMPRVSGLAASATSATTSLTVTTGEGAYFRAGDVARITVSGEAVKVTSVSTDTLTVTRSWGDVAAATAASGTANLVIVGNVSAQGATSGTAKVVKRVRGYNYTGIQRNPFSFTRTQTQINLYTGGEPDYELAKKAVEHKRSIEATLFFGARDFNTGGSEPIGSCGGAQEYISTNITNAGGALTPAEMDTFLEGPFGVGSTNKVIFCSPRAGTVLSQMYRGIWQPERGGQQKYGVKVDAWLESTYAGWSVPIFVKREWQDQAKTAAGDYGTWLFIIDMDSVRLRELQPVILRRNIQAPDADRVTHEYLCEFSLEFQHQKHHGILKNITSYSAT